MTIKMRLLIGPAFSVGLLLASLPGAAGAQKFNSLIANPFVFCSMPKPCRLCQPWRRIYQEICDDQQNTHVATAREQVALTTPIVVSVDRDGQKSYSRVVDGWTIRSSNRADLEDANLNADEPEGNVQVVDGPIAEAQLR